jgi:hypothetical protein
MVGVSAGARRKGPLHRLKRSLNRRLHSRDIMLLRSFPSFAPNSRGDYASRAKIAVDGANGTFPRLVQLIHTFDGGLDCPTPIESFDNSEPALAAAGRLQLLFNKYGSDKSSSHDYHHLYGSILAQCTQAPNILEIGMGTNAEDVVSNMNGKGSPGGSLRAFSEFAPDASVYGADIDARILFDEGRIRTCQVDQTDPESLARLFQKFNCGFDLIIDDGLHAPHANISTLTFALQNLKPGGWVVVEDIADAAIPIWKVVSRLLPAGHQATLILAKAGVLFAVRGAN